MHSSRLFYSNVLPNINGLSGVKQLSTHLVGASQLKRDDGWYANGFAADSSSDDGTASLGAFALWSPEAVAHVVGAEGAALFSRCYLSDDRSELLMAGLP